MRQPRPAVAASAPPLDLIFFTAHSPYALAPPDFCIRTTRIPSTTRKTMIGVLPPTFSLITWNRVNIALRISPPAYIIAPTKIPKNRETYTCLVTSANIIAISAGKNAHKVPSIVALLNNKNEI